MHQTRQEISVRLPIVRKGTKYVVRASSHHRDAVPVLIAVREMLSLAENAKEVKKMIIQKLLKVNWTVVEDYKQSIKLFNILDADKTYRLTLSASGKFMFEENPEKNLRLCKVVNKCLVRGGKVQLNLHDGTNIISKEKINVSDSVYLDEKLNIKKHLPFKEGAKAFIISGKYAGKTGKITSISDNQIKIKLTDNEPTLNKKSIIIQ